MWFGILMCGSSCLGWLCDSLGEALTGDLVVEHGDHLVELLQYSNQPDRLDKITILRVA